MSTFKQKIWKEKKSLFICYKLGTHNNLQEGQGSSSFCGFLFDDSKTVHNLSLIFSPLHSLCVFVSKLIKSTEEQSNWDQRETQEIMPSTNHNNRFKSRNKNLLTNATLLNQIYSRMHLIMSFILAIVLTFLPLPKIKWYAFVL